MSKSVPASVPESGRCEMLRALYDFTSSTQYAKSLSFQVDDVFIFYEINTKKRQWWEVVNNKGNVGYVPSNYVDTIQVTLKYFLQFLDGCIQVLREEEKCGGLRNDRQKLLHFLLDRRLNSDRSGDSTSRKRAPPPPEARRSSALTYSAGASNGVGEGDVAQIASSTQSQISVYSASKHRGGSFAKPLNDIVPEDYNRKAVASKAELNADAVNKQTSYQNGEVTTTKSSEKVQSALPKENSIVPSTEEHESVSQKHKLPTSSPQPSTYVKKSLEDESLTAYKMVEQVRRHTDLSHELSRVAVGVIVARLQDLLTPDVDPRLCLGTILRHCQGRMEAPRIMIEETFDAARLQVVFTELTSCKEDSQQRSWMLHEDEPTIIEYINELTSILTNADASISRHMMSLDHYNVVSTLIQYYQMEVRWSIRRQLLQTFGVMCNLDAVIITLMLNSILPMELARDIQANPKNVPRLLYSSLLLTMIFSMAEPMPIGHLEYLGLEFISFLLDLMETPPDSDTDDQIPDRFLNLILSYNLQFTDPLQNYVLKALEEKQNAKTFTEKALVLINREEDPVRVFDHTPAPPNAVLKLFIDLFSSTKTAKLFYSSDVKVLIDIIARQLADLSAGDQRRAQYLEMCKLVLPNSEYQAHLHRCDDLQKCFIRIFCEETEESQEDQRLVRIIWNKFPQYFQS